MTKKRADTLEQEVIFIACDYSKNTGEGRLARNFVELISENKNYLARSTSVKALFSSERSGHAELLRGFRRLKHVVKAYGWLLLHAALSRAFVSRQYVFVNYLPLWDILFFLLVSRRAIIAPVTGSGEIVCKQLEAGKLTKVQINLFRNFLLPILCRFSSRIITYRGLHVLPATPAVASYFGDTEHKYFFASCMLEGKETSKKLQSPFVYDVIVYTNAHILKNNVLLEKFVKRLLQMKLKICLIDPDNMIPLKHENLLKFSRLDHSGLMAGIAASKSALTLSLEGAGLFPQEAIFNGCMLFCLPNTAASKYPGAIELPLADSELDIAKASDYMVKRIENKVEKIESIEFSRWVLSAKNYYIQNYR